MSLINSMLNINPKKRLTIEQIKKHPYYNGPTLTKREVIEELKSRKKVIR